MKGSHRIIGYDLIRIIAIFMVVVIHSNVLYLGSNQGSVGWIIVMEITAGCLMAVPLFFMVSGALLLDCDDVISGRELFLKRLPKQAIPFIVWSFIYTMIRIVMGKLPLTSHSFIQLFYEPAYYQFWFMYTLLAIYLLLPVIQVIVLHLNKKQIEYILILWIIFSILIPMLTYMIPGFMISEHVDLVLCEGYIGYFILGFYLKKYRKEYSNRIAIAMTIVGLVITSVASLGEWQYSVINGIDFKGYVYSSYLLPGVAITVIGIFILFQKITIKGMPEKIIIKASKLSLGVFYLHMLVMTALEYIGMGGKESIVILLVKIVLTYLVSTIMAIIIFKIPFLCWTLNGNTKWSRNGK